MAEFGVRNVPAVYHPHIKLAIAKAGGENDSIDRGAFRRRPFRRCLGSKRLIVGAVRRNSGRFRHFRRLRLGFEKLEPRQMPSATAGTGDRQMEYLNRGMSPFIKAAATITSVGGCWVLTPAISHSTCTDNWTPAPQ